MAKRKVSWLREAELDMFEITRYYTQRNKSKTYSTKLYREIKEELRTLDFSIALPQRTSVENLFYFTYNHISVFFSFENNTIFVKIVIDDRRDPKSINKLLLKSD
ncbi:type II toxin-antitoxin system RelE/ParE family toxin [Flavobacterium sp. ZT3R18]|uniref:type II toxin-antitoxin system RelE/ParE family toxin n=1 Tax=Flavobacterium sp. ZT3R18 TaxID=2594429 RepID=UPI00117AD362|nr:type II toxin-antitoxin system RelE/ParE family toxin [Flavobacterium sp. ZT3R18]TRX33483.1 type II toxin-antitoxin system RelE/ParE family toxin [Flavobacterium sp. ZT3R18]